LQGRAQPRPAVAMRARAVARVADGQRLAAGLDGVAKRLGLAIEPRGGDRWRAHDPESGARAVLRLVGEHAVLDVALPSAPGERVEAVPPDEAPWPALPPAPISAGVRPAGLAALEAAIGGSAALAGVAEREAASALPVLIAAAEVMAACTARWSAAAGVVDEITATLDAPDGRPRLLGEARLTERGAAAWTATRTAPPLRSLDELPVVAQAAVDPAAFRAASGIEADWWDETSACAAGAAAGAVVAGIWPALAERLPVPAPPGGWTAPARGLAAALTGANAVDGAAVPALAGVWIVDAETPRATAPLGPGGEAVQPGVWASAEGVPVVFADRAIGDHRALVMAIGGGAWTAIEPRLAPDSTAPDPAAPLLDIRLDPHRLASALTHAGERGAGVAALVALGERFGRWRLHVEQAGRAVRWTLDARAAPPTVELDRPPGAK
jgi:hypothetical protein